MQSLDNLITRLGVKQVQYKQPPQVQLDVQPYPVDFEYLGRSLHRFPQISQFFKIVNIKTPTLQKSILYSIYGANSNVENIQAIRFQPKPTEPTKLENITAEQLCESLGINLIILGPDEEHIRKYFHPIQPQEKPKENQPDMSKNQSAFTTELKNQTQYCLVFNDYYNNFYPIISSEKKEVYLFDESHTCIQSLLATKE